MFFTYIVFVPSFLVKMEYKFKHIFTLDYALIMVQQL